MFDGHMFGFGWMWFVWIVVLLGVVLLAVVLVRTLGRNDVPRPPDGTSRARAILEERLARGEIDAGEFRERLRALDEDKP